MAKLIPTSLSLGFHSYPHTRDREDIGEKDIGMYDLRVCSIPQLCATSLCSYWIVVPL